MTWVVRAVIDGNVKYYAASGPVPEKIKWCDSPRWAHKFLTKGRAVSLSFGLADFGGVEVCMLDESSGEAIRSD